MAYKKNTLPSVDEEVKTTEQAPAETKAEPSFSKAQLLKSNWYSHRRDVLAVVLDDESTYTHAEVGDLIIEFMKGKVK